MRPQCKLKEDAEGDMFSAREQRSRVRRITPSKVNAEESTSAKGGVTKFLATAVFFSTGFCLIFVAERLVTRGSGIEIAGFFRVLIGGLIVAVGLLIVDSLPIVHAFQGKPLIYTIAWKSALYIAVSLVYRYIKPLLTYLFQGMGISAAHSRALQQFMLPKMWAIDIWVAMLLVVYVTMQELSRVIGSNQLKYMFFGQRAKPGPERSFRDAA
jgi:hypothetical protein